MAPPAAAGAAAHHPTAPWLRDASAGALAGSANLVTGFPFDTVKVTMQSARAAGAPYPSAAAALRDVVSRGGPLALFRGMAVPLAGAAGETAVNYAAYTAGLRAAGFGLGGGGGGGEAGARPPLSTVALAAAGAGAALSPVLSPAELIKVRLQTDAAAAAGGGGGSGRRARAFSGPAACVRATLACEGVAGLLTRGLGATAAREVPGNAIFFVVYEALRRSVLPPPPPAPGGRGGGPSPSPPPPPSSSSLLSDAASAIACGAVAGAAMWGAVLPVDAVKTAIQAGPPGSAAPGMVDAARSLYSAGGRTPRAFYAGLGPVLARAAPANAAQWLAWELAVRGWGAGG